MIFSITSLFTLVCVHFINSGRRSNDARHLVLSVLGLFSLGHYVLPVVFRQSSQLQNVNDDELFVVMCLSGLFFLGIWLGFHISGSLAKGSPATPHRRAALDVLLLRRPRVTFAIFAILYFLYLVSSVRTIYQAGSVEDYISARGSWNAGLDTLGSIAASGMAVTLASEASQGRRFNFAMMLVFYLSSLIFLFGAAQRAALIAPFISLALAFALFGLRKAMKFTIISAVALLIVASPFLVLMRGVNDSAISGIDLSDGVQVVFLISILDRADGLLNMISLKHYIDTHGFANGQYFYSIAVKYIPGFLYPGKPIGMSETGGIDGHLSVIAWQLMVDSNSLGSLTVFGPITAYHEGGWLWVALNGILTGVSFNFLYGLLASRSHWRKIIYILIFPALCLENVPPSFLYIFVSLSTTFYIFCFFAIVETLLRPYMAPSPHRGHLS
jgi:oligosaccharide repeat unit polymerase